MNTFDFIILSANFAILLGIGIYFSKRAFFLPEPSPAPVTVKSSEN